MRGTDPELSRESAPALSRLTSSCLPPWTAWFLGSSGLLLGTLGLAKLAALWTTRTGPLSDPPDPVFPILTSRTIEACAAAVELSLGVLLSCGRRRSWAPWLLAWWVAMVLLYRASRWLLGTAWKVGCGCLGPLPAWLGLTNTFSTHLVWAILLYWCAGLAALFLGFRRRSCPSLALSAALLLPRALHAADSEHLHLQGTIVTTCYFENGREQSHAVSAFEVRVATDAWWIRNGNNHAFGVGSNNFGLLWVPSEQVAVADAHFGYYPLFESQPTIYPWIAYCSGIFFRHHADDIHHLPLPGYVALTQPEAHTCEARITFLDPVLLLPAQIEWVTTLESLKNAANSRFLRPPLHPREFLYYYMDYTTLYPTGMVRQTYRVLATTNLGPRMLPLSAEFVAYLQRGLYPDLSGEPTPKTGNVPHTANLKETFVSERSLLTLTHAAVVSGPVPFDRLLPVPADVTDMRLRSHRWGVYSVRYRVLSPPGWKFTPDAELTNLFEAALRSGQTQVLLRYGLRAMLYLAFGLLVALPLWWIGRHMRRARPSPQTIPRPRQP